MQAVENAERRRVPRTIWIGTSGWTYRHWKGRFYPRNVPQRLWLAYYASRFPTVELNVTTYRLPKPGDLARWNDVPPDFRYSVKMSRLVTHRRRPGEPRPFVDRFFASIAPLGNRIANVLAQFPPSFSRDDAALISFLDVLPRDHRYVVEFRHPSWYCEAVYELLRAYGASLCLHDMAGAIAPIVTTGPVLYVRLHGPVRAYTGSYRRARLERWAATIRRLEGGVGEVFVYFNNDERAFAPRNAAMLGEMLGKDEPYLLS
jgi:uncharacterized protein YecE (DUF72 family)